MTKQKPSVKNYNAIKEVFNLTDFKTFSGREALKIFTRLKVSRALLTLLIDAKICKRVTRGKYVFLRQPVLADGALVIKLLKTRPSQKAKRVRVAPVVKQPVKQTVKKLKVDSLRERSCINYLKERGYEVYKPVISLKKC